MPASIGVNLRVTGHCSQGGRKYMEDLFSVAYQQTEDERDLEYAFFGIYDGHGGSEAASFAKEHLMDSIVKQRQFWSDNDEDVLKAIRNGYMMTHLNMWKELEKWPKTITGLPSTAGTTASVAFIRRGKIYIGHVGDSAIVLGYQKDGSDEWAAKPLTLDHKPESTAEIERIQSCGGKVVSKAGVPRVVWNRPRPGHKGPIKKNTPMDEIPFLAVARSLGDLWSYNHQNDEFIVSPDPDVGVLNIDPTKFRCLVFGTDGLWNMISPEGAVSLVQATERHNEAALVSGNTNQPRDWLNPSKSLVDHALERWSNTRMRADNTSVVTLMLDPPGPPRATVLRSRTSQKPVSETPAVPANPTPTPKPQETKPEVPEESRTVPQNGLTIMTRYSDVDKAVPSPETPKPLPPCTTLDGRFTVQEEKDEEDTITNYGNPAESYFMARLLNRSNIVNTLSDVYDEIVKGSSEESEVPPETTISGGDLDRSIVEEPAVVESEVKEVESIQINEVSSSSPTEVPPKGRGRKPKGEVKPAVNNDRVLRSHHEAETPPRPQTRQAATRGRPTGGAPMERVVILSRRAAPAGSLTKDKARRASPVASTRASPVASTRAAASLPARATRSQLAGNCMRTPRPRPPDCSKENRARAPSHEVHSTTPETCNPHPPQPPLRALRSRNEPEVSNKRARCEETPTPAAKTPKLTGERCAKALGKRSTGPWAPALALRNRLRRRLAK